MSPGIEVWQSAFIHPTKDLAVFVRGHKPLEYQSNADFAMVAPTQWFFQLKAPMYFVAVIIVTQKSKLFGRVSTESLE